MAEIKDLKRMCDFYPNCAGCPIESKLPCTPHRYVDSIDEIVDKWVAEHPVKTYAMDFFSKFPDAQRKASGIPVACIRVIYSEFYDEDCPTSSCYECWNQKMGDE